MVTALKVDVSEVLDDLVGPAKNAHETQARVSTLLHFEQLLNKGWTVPDHGILELMVGEYYDGVLDTLKVRAN